MVAFLLPLSEARAAGDGVAPPAWVERFPLRPDEYIGIGSADKRAHPGDYRDRARASALAQISREISVQVTAGNAFTRTEDSGGNAETYADRIATATRNALEGYRLEGVYETDDRFWAYYALDKETLDHALEERERRHAAWLDAEVAALDADLGARRIQRAADRYARIREVLDSSFNQDLLPRNRSRSIPSSFASLSRKLEAAARDADLRANAPVWIFSPTVPQAALPSVSLTDAATGAAWAGPLTLAVSDRAHPGAPTCALETDAQGRVDLSRPFLECGLDPGVWRVAWKGPEGAETHFEIEAGWKRIDVAMSITAEPGRSDPDPSVPDRRISADAKLIGRLRSALEGMAGRRYRIVPDDGRKPDGGRLPEGGRLPVLLVRVREVTLDSLEGLYFASLRADVVLPAGLGKAGKAGAMEVRGKGGHTDRDRARAVAIGDFARALQAALEGD